MRTHFARALWRRWHLCSLGGSATAMDVHWEGLPYRGTARNRATELKRPGAVKEGEVVCY